MSYRIDRVDFDDLDLVLRIVKARGLDRADALSLFSSEENRRAVIERYDSLRPLRVVDALRLPNVAQRMAALRAFPAETVAADASCTTIDRQTIRKSQIRWDASLQPHRVEFDDTYELLSFDADRRLTVHVVRCVCPSTGRTFALYVPPQVARAGDAIAAVAWTIQIDGRPLTRKQYLRLLHAET